MQGRRRRQHHHAEEGNGTHRASEHAGKHHPEETNARASAGGSGCDSLPRRGDLKCGGHQQTESLEQRTPMARLRPPSVARSQSPRAPPFVPAATTTTARWLLAGLE
jgi:hypothetical protein